MADIDIVFKDRIVEFPHRYAMTDNGDGTYTLIPFPGEITEEGTPVNAGNLNEIVSRHNALYDEVGVMQRSASGCIAYTDSIPAGDKLTKTISVPVGVRRGIAVVNDFDSDSGILIHFTTNNQDGKATGNSGIALNRTSSVWSVRLIGTVTDDSHGPQATGHHSIYINQLYIDAPNNVLKIEFENTSAQSRALDCLIAWEVFY